MSSETPRKLLKKILSWDIGIKNLAYAIVAFYDNNTTKIIDMGIINTVDFRETCCYDIRGGGKCNNIAQASFKIKEKNDKELYYCKAHLKKANYEIALTDDNITCCKCKQNSHKIIKGTCHGWCEKHFTKDIDIYKRRCVKKFSQNCNKQSLTKIGNSMFTKLDNHPNKEKMFDVDQVLIELQPVKKNANMKSVAVELLSYFILRGITEKKGKFHQDEIAGVKTVLASGKLKVDRNTTNTQISKASSERVVYSITKNLSIIYAKHLMKKKDIKKLEKYKKKDDICDAYLQAISNYYGFELPEIMKNKLEKAHEEVLKLEQKTKKKKKKTIVIDIPPLE